MFDEHLNSDALAKRPVREYVNVAGTKAFWATKRVIDVVLSILLLPVLVVFAILLQVLNPFLNQGPLFFVQQRMGRDCTPFSAIKFRSMQPAVEILRRHSDPIEIERITLLGKIMRKCRVDELPQILNVLKGDMSLIGPRPDFLDHAKIYADTIPGYKARYSIRPGISGLAQVQLGYAEGTDATRAKTQADHFYIENVGFALDSKILLKTLVVVAVLGGS